MLRILLASAVCACAGLAQQTPTVIYAAASGDVYKSTNGGTSWTATHIVGSDPNRYLPQVAELTALTASNSASTVFAIRFSVVFDSDTGLFRSGDAGATWRRIRSGRIAQVIIDPRNPANVYVVDQFNGGLLKSKDSGLTFQQTVLTSPGVIGIAPSNPSILYSASFLTGVFKSSDFGVTWTQVGVRSLQNVSSMDPKILAVDPANPQTLYLGGDGLCTLPNGQTYICPIIKSTDGGATFSSLLIAGTRLQGSLDDLKIDAATGTLYATGPSDSVAGDIVKSNDGLATYTLINNGLLVPEVLTIAIDPQNSSTLYAGTKGRDVFYKSTNGGGLWVPLRGNLPVDLGSISALAVSAAQQTPPPPTLSSNSLVNAASLLPASIAPGEILSLFGSNLGPTQGVGLKLDQAGRVETSLSGVHVYFSVAGQNNIPAPLLFVRSDQVNLVAPYELAGQKLAVLWVDYNGATSTNLVKGVSDTAPALFTFGSGTGQAAALNQDGSINSGANPANRGSVVVLFATGEGQTDPPGSNGMVATSVYPKPRAQVSVRIGGQTAEVLYAGAAPGLVSGALQVNARIPDNSTVGNATPVVLSIGGVASPGNVTLAVN